MLIPLKTDRPQKNVPWVNYSIIVLNVFFYILTSRGSFSLPRDSMANQWMLFPSDPNILHFVTYQFLHADISHIFFNMLFLYIFGNAVEDRLGKIGYLFFYLTGGVLAGLGHVVTSDAPVLGASGAIAAVTGAYLALFPKARVLIIYFFFFIGFIEVSSMLIILFSIGKDILFQFIGTDNVAYTAHLAGYAFGFVICMLLLRFRLLPREPYDMMSMFEQYKRRQEFRRIVRDQGSPWSAEEGSHKPKRKRRDLEPEIPPEILELRSAIQTRAAEHDIAGAASLYRELLTKDDKQVMSERLQSDLASQLAAESQHQAAASAFRNFIKTYPAAPQTSEMRLMLGVLYARYLDQPEQAREIIQQAMGSLSSGQRDFAQQILDELGGTHSAN